MKNINRNLLEIKDRFGPRRDMKRPIPRTNTFTFWVLIRYLGIVSFSLLLLFIISVRVVSKVHDSYTYTRPKHPPLQEDVFVRFFDPCKVIYDMDMDSFKVFRTQKGNVDEQALLHYLQQHGWAIENTNKHLHATVIDQSANGLDPKLHLYWNKKTNALSSSEEDIPVNIGENE